MCRLFVKVSASPVRSRPEFHTLNQFSYSHRDGWGVAQLDPRGNWTTAKSIAPAHTSTFEHIGAHSPSRVTLAHLRLASVGKLDIQNNHPFEANGWVFMHNGTVTNFAGTRHLIEREIAPEFRAQLKGATDSERCFGLFLTFLGGRADVEISEAAQALSRTSRFVSGLSDTAANASKLNFVASNGKITLATRRGHTLVSNQGRSAVSIASEPLTPGQSWRVVPENGLIAVDDTLSVYKSSTVDWK